MKYLKCLLRTLILFLIFLLLITTLHYFDVLSNNIAPFFYLLCMIISTFIGGIYLGRRCETKGYLEGMKLAGILLLLLLMFRFIIFRLSFRLDLLLYYVIIFISAISGSIIGINKKIEKH